MKLIYGVCYYYERNIKKNILDHINIYNEISSEKIFVITLMIDSKDKKIRDRYKEDMENFLSKKIKNFLILPEFNWGGTISGLWLCYNYFSEKEDHYIMFFEEDFICTRNINILFSESLSLLHKDNYYIGESTDGKIHYTDCKGCSLCNFLVKNYNFPRKEVWTDGGYYFSSAEKLKLVAKKIGIFHKGNKETKYDHLVDGIDFGEVGFPTLLFHNNFKYDTLYRNKYFKHKT